MTEIELNTKTCDYEQRIVVLPPGTHLTDCTIEIEEDKGSIIFTVRWMSK